MASPIDLQGVTKRYRHLTAVDQLNMRVEAGERIALVGHNGAGKTTLMKLMLGLVRPSAGSIQVLGTAPSAANAARFRRKLGFLPENVAFDEALTGFGLLRFYARLKGCPPAECVSLLERVGLHGAADARVRTYSKGMRQRLGLAQALLGSPRVLLLDEPTGGLDPGLRQRFYEIIESLKAKGAAVVLSSHLLTELEARTERIIIMARGRIVAEGSVSKLRRESRLPLRFHLMTAGGNGRVLERFAQATDLTVNGASNISFTAAPEDKMAVVQAIGELGNHVRDIEVISPSLDDVYAYFVPDEGRPCGP